MDRAARIALGIVLLSVLLSPLRRELFVGDETKYSQVVREMRAGSFVVPTLNGTPFTHKPPLHFWIVTALTYIFGVYSIWPFVLPSLIAFALLLGLMQKAWGTMAAFVCGTSLLLWGSSQTARMDVAFTALLAYAAYRIWHADGALPLSAGIATGLAFLFKGPMAPVITIALFVFESIRRRRKPQLRDALALLPMLLLPLVWLVPALIVGGEAYWNEIFYRQTVGRAVNAWVHKSPPWFYIVRSPATLAPWFFLAMAALGRVLGAGFRVPGAFRKPQAPGSRHPAPVRPKDEQSKFAVSWMLAVLVPYTLLSSKLDVYMMAMLPAMAVLVGRFVEREDPWVRRAALVTLALFAIIGIAGLIVQPSQIKGEDAALIALPSVRGLFVVLAVASIAGIVFTLRSGGERPARHDRASRPIASALAVGLVPVIALAYTMTVLMPLANELASTRPLVRALTQQNVPPEQIGLYVCPHLWVRDMPPALSRARHYDADALRIARPQLIVARRKDAAQIADVLREYRKTGELRMIGKWFDVYRR